MDLYSSGDEDSRGDPVWLKMSELSRSRCTNNMHRERERTCVEEGKEGRGGYNPCDPL